MRGKIGKTKMKEAIKVRNERGIDKQFGNAHREERTTITSLHFVLRENSFKMFQHKGNDMPVLFYNIQC